MEEKFNIQDESGDKKYFTIIPNYIYNHSTIWDREVYCQMKRIAGEDGDCWISQENLAKQCGISVFRLKKSLKYLLSNKWIVFSGKKRSNKNDTEGTNVYKISNLWKLNIEFYENKKAVSPDNTASKKAVSPNDTASSKGGIVDEEKAVSSETYKEEPYKEYKYINTNTSSSATPTDNSFDVFWDLYPRKVEKKKALQKWNKLKPETKKIIIADLPKRKMQSQWMKGFVPHPTTYLNGERWNDELEDSQITEIPTFKGYKIN